MFFLRFLAGNIFCGLLICIISGIKKLLGHRLTPRHHYYIWFVLLISLCLVFVPDSFFKAFDFSGFPLPGHITVTTGAADGPTATLSGASGWMQDFSQSVSRADSGQLSLWITALWLCGAALSAMAYLAGALRLRRLKRQLSPPKSAISLAFKQCQSVIPCCGRVRLCQSGGIKGPLTFGLFTHYLLLPESIAQQLTLPEIKNILLHELCHIKNRDILLNHLICALQALYWFNPLVWYAFSRLRRDRELFCDNSVLAKLPSEKERLDYGYTLLNFAGSSASAFSTASSAGGTKKQLLERIMAISRYEKSNRKKRCQSILVCLLTVLIALTQVPLMSVFASGADHYVPPKDITLSTEHLDTYLGSTSGCFVLYDQSHDRYQAWHPEKITERSAPFSTYKIYSALNALEQGIITPDANTLAWDQQPYPFEAWNQDQDLETAMSHSVNWYFRRLDAQAGLRELRQFYHFIAYGNAEVGHSTDDYWNASTLKISPLEQVELLKKLRENAWGFSAQNIEAVKNALLLSDSPDCRLYGKTGSGRVNGQNVSGWFVGYVETPDNTYYFATSLQDSANATGPAAAQLTLSILQDMGILQ
ncbi:BlaR1 family beta-lactam sensor/signal transducer [Eubacterium sp. 1001713B170207_170306_E7]|uniref:BlaR1 family beta-lactam sensor/signal transducer n=1 Tax=Eubacterium sp. 1001713B170207_170306_E7 TaxID=2787097 RepID=UPI001899723C|nr:BlaR1 family beta-lactam sensor/signal transducer [Eubacterium sp. 1001713B170207_170306_E7]